MEVIYLKSEEKSFSWNNGLFIVVKKNDDFYHLCKLKKGKPTLTENGDYEITCTGKGNKGIYETGLLYLDKKALRKEKIKKINQNE